MFGSVAVSKTLPWRATIKPTGLLDRVQMEPGWLVPDWPLTEPGALRLGYITSDCPSCPQRGREHNRADSTQSVLSYTLLGQVKDKSELIDRTLRGLGPGGMSF